MKDQSPKQYSRRDFLQMAAAGAVTLFLPDVRTGNTPQGAGALTEQVFLPLIQTADSTVGANGIPGIACETEGNPTSRGTITYQIGTSRVPAEAAGEGNSSFTGFMRSTRDENYNRSYVSQVLTLDENGIPGLTEIDLGTDSATAYQDVTVTSPVANTHNLIDILNLPMEELQPGLQSLQMVAHAFEYSTYGDESASEAQDAALMSMEGVTKTDLGTITLNVAPWRRTARDYPNNVTLSLYSVNNAVVAVGSYSEIEVPVRVHFTTVFGNVNCDTPQDN